MSRPNSGSSSEHRSALAEGTRLQNYTIERVLGAGGFGITYMAREDVTGRAVAIKEYLPSALAVRVRDGLTVQPVSDTSRPDYEWGLTRFRQEAKLLLSLRHPNIVPSLAYFEGNGTAYLVMEYQDGQTLANLMGGGTAIEESEVREFLDGLLDGVEAVHKAGLLHRDIKPDNIFIRNDGTPVLIDFGSARMALGHHSHSLTAVVTDGYAPFEQYERGGDQGPWTDIYAVGAVLFRCLVGHRPPTATKRLSAQYRGTPDPAAPSFATLRQRASRPLANAIEAALAVNAEDRPQSVADLRALIADTGARGTVRRPEGANPTLVAGTRERGTHAPGTQSLGAPAPNSDRGYESDEPRRRRVLPLVAALALLLLGGGAAAAYFGVGGINVPGFTSDAAEQEAKRLADEAAKRKAEDEARRLAAENEARRKAEEEEAKRRAEDEKRRAEDDKRRAEEAKRRAEEEKRRAAEDARRAEEEKKRADENARRRAEEERARREEERRRAEEEEVRRRADAEARRKAEEEARRRADEEAKRRADDEARRKAEEEARSRADQGARPSWYAAANNRGAVYFAYRGATLEGSAVAALTNLVADARNGANYRLALVAGSGRNEGNGAEGARLRQQRLDAVRVWLIARGIDGDRIRTGHAQPRGDGADQRFVTIVLEQQVAATPDRGQPDRGQPDRGQPDRGQPDRGQPDRGQPDRGQPDRPGNDRTTPPPDAAPRYSRAELQTRMFRLIKGEAYEPGRMQHGTEGALSGGDGVSATAVCVNWEQTTPQKAVIGGAYSWTARSASLLGERALAGCRAMGRGGCVCQVLEVGGSRVLAIPESFMQRYAQ